MTHPGGKHVPALAQTSSVRPTTRSRSPLRSGWPSAPMATCGWTPHTPRLSQPRKARTNYSAVPGFGLTAAAYLRRSAVPLTLWVRMPITLAVAACAFSTGQLLDP
jgi:hypothetical protein